MKIDTLSPAIITTRPEIRRGQRRAVLATALFAIVTIYWSHQWPAAEANDARTAIASALFRVGDHVCRKNDGLLSIEAYPAPRQNEFTFVCRDGASWPKVSARISR